MKKELLAAILLLALLVGGALNARFLDGFTREINDALSQSQERCAAGSYDAALSLAEAAHKKWHSREAYTGVFIRHSEIDAVTYGFHDLIGALEAEPESAAALYPGLIGHVRSLYEMERVNWGSVF